MEDNQIYSIQLLENEGITPSMGGGYDKSYCPTKQEFIDSGFSKSGYNISIDGIIAINQLIPKTALTETASVIKFDLNPISLYPCSDWCAEDGGEQDTPSATTYGTIMFSGVSSVVMSLINGVAASIELCTDKNNIYGTLVQDFQWSFYSADTFTVDGEEWIFGIVDTVLPENKTNENKKYYLVLNYQYETAGNQSIFEIIQSKYWEPPYWYVSTGLNFPSAVPKSGGRYAVTIKDPYNVGWIIDDNTEYNITKRTGKGDTTFNVEIPQATTVGAQTGAIYGFRPIVVIGDEIYVGNGTPPDGYVNIRDVPATEECLGSSSDCINVWQYGLDKPSLSKFPSTMTLPDTKRWESAPNGNMDYLVGSSVTNSDYVEYMIQLPNWCIFKGKDISFHSGGTNCYSGTSPHVNFSLQINPNSYFDKSHYDGDMKLYYKEYNRYYLADTKKIVKCARPYIETNLDTAHGNISWKEQDGQILVNDTDKCGYYLSISGDSNYSAWTISNFSPITKYNGSNLFQVTKIPQNLTDNDIEGYINLHSSYYSKQILESIPFKQECYKLKVYFTGQNFKDGYSTKKNFKYLTLWDQTVMSNFIPLADDFNPLNVSEGISIRKSAYTDLDKLLISNHFYDILCSDRYIDSYLSSNVFVRMAERVSTQTFHQITHNFSRQKDSITIYL